MSPLGGDACSNLTTNTRIHRFPIDRWSKLSAKSIIRFLIILLSFVFPNSVL